MRSSSNSAAPEVPDHRCGPGTRPRPATVLSAIVVAAAMLPAGAGRADPTAQTMTGVPQQVVPTYLETGVPAFSIQAGQPAAGSGGSTGTGSSSDSPGTPAAPSSALNTLLAQSWGQAAASEASALGVNPSALAATCVAESGCQNVGGTGTITGAFQMTQSTYNAMIAAALQQDPSLASSIVPGTAGMNDPATEAIAASEYLAQGAAALQAAGISDPSVLDIRGYYNFGPSGGIAIATAPPDATMSSVLSNFSAATLAANGITPGETVAQWQAGVASKIGNAAGQSVPNT